MRLENSGTRKKKTSPFNAGFLDGDFPLNHGRKGSKKEMFGKDNLQG